MKRIMLLCALCITGVTGWFYFTLDTDKALNKNLGDTRFAINVDQEQDSTANKNPADDTLAGDIGSFRVFRINESHPYYLNNNLLK